jgi:3',5'-nucleoside bisphosphate phosphatase
MIDLHMHSTFSDGSFTPSELAAKAKQFGLTAIALTDHDCTDGIDELLKGCKTNSGGPEVTGIPGVEISADVKHGTMHILGYFIDHKNAKLEKALVRIRDGRKIRNEEILRKLNGLGFTLTWDDVAAFAKEDVVGRPHFAQAMISKGYIASSEKAFGQYLKKGRPAYADRFRFSAGDSIGVILEAGGVPVLAHPFTLELDRQALRNYVTELTESGLLGIEVFYPEHSPAMVTEYLALAKEVNLVATGGSDFHGASNPSIRMGIGFGPLKVPDQVVADLKKAKAAIAARGRG